MNRLIATAIAMTTAFATWDQTKRDDGTFVTACESITGRPNTDEDCKQPLLPNCYEVCNSQIYEPGDLGAGQYVINCRLCVRWNC